MPRGQRSRRNRAQTSFDGLSGGAPSRAGAARGRSSCFCGRRKYRLRTLELHDRNVLDEHSLEAEVIGPFRRQAEAAADEISGKLIE